MARMKLWIIYELHGTKSSPEWNYSNSTIIFNVHYFGFPTLLFPCTFFVLASIIAQQRPNHIFMNLVENQEKQKINQTAAPTQTHKHSWSGKAKAIVLMMVCGLFAWCFAGLLFLSTKYHTSLLWKWLQALCHATISAAAAIAIVSAATKSTTQQK